MAEEPEVIRQNIDETRSQLSQKIEVLEQEVVGTVKGTTAVVAATVQNVKGTVEDTVESMKDTIETTLESVKETFDLRIQTQRHPWAVVSGSVLAGFVVGSFLPPRRKIARPFTPTMAAPLSQPAYQADVSSRSAVPESAPRRPSLFASLMEHFGPEIEQLKGVAIGAAAAVVRDMIKDKIPEGLQPHVQDMIHNVTHKLGGEDIQGPILSTSEEPESSLTRHERFASKH